MERHTLFAAFARLVRADSPRLSDVQIAAKMAKTGFLGLVCAAAGSRSAAEIAYAYADQLAAHDSPPTLAVGVRQ